MHKETIKKKKRKVRKDKLPGTEYERKCARLKSQFSGLIKMLCLDCSKEVLIEEYKIKLQPKKKVRCYECQSEVHRRARMSYCTFEDSSRRCKKSWQTIKKDPVYYNKICKKMSDRMKKVWAEQYSDEKKSEILKKLVGGGTNGRSKISDKVKSKMQECGLYEGFASEESFGCFIADEINHKLKIIIEVFGDLYHCNPRKYKDPNQFINAIKRTVGEQWERDRIKLATYYKHGYSVIIVWEKDFTRNPKKEIQRIKDEISKKRNLDGKI